MTTREDLLEFSADQTLFALEPGPVVLVSTHSEKGPNVMTISWTMPIDFNNHFALTTGPWNYSFKALTEQKECVIGIPGADLAETVVRVGDCSGREVDKFRKFHLTPLKAKFVAAPLIGECLVNLECRVVEYLEKYGIFILETLTCWKNLARVEPRCFHARGDGTFIMDGGKIDHKDLMADKLPPAKCTIL